MSSRFALPAILSVIALGLCANIASAATYVGGGGLINDTTVNTFDILIDNQRPVPLSPLSEMSPLAPILMEAIHS